MAELGEEKNLVSNNGYSVVGAGLGTVSTVDALVLINGGGSENLDLLLILYLRAEEEMTVRLLDVAV